MATTGKSVSIESRGGLGRRVLTKEEPFEEGKATLAGDLRSHL